MGRYQKGLSDKEGEAGEKNSQLRQVAEAEGEEERERETDAEQVLLKRQLKRAGQGTDRAGQGSI